MRTRSRRRRASLTTTPPARCLWRFRTELRDERASQTGLGSRQGGTLKEWLWAAVGACVLSGSMGCQMIQGSSRGARSVVRPSSGADDAADVRLLERPPVGTFAVPEDAIVRVVGPT